MRWLFALSLALAITSRPAVAQEPATDNELFAGYCFGALLGSSMLFKITALQDCGSDDACLKRREDGAKVQKALEANQQRASDYLRARRLFDERRNSTAWAGVEKAMDAASADFKACTDDGRGKNIDRAACDRMNRCNDLSRLPI